MAPQAGGGSISRRPLAFSADGKLLLVPCGSSLRVYSAATTHLVASLQGHSADITCVVSDPKNGQQAYTASLDGTIRLWNYVTLACVRVLQVREAIEHLAINAQLDVAYLSIHWREGSSGRVLAYDLAVGKAGRTAMKTRSPAPVVVSPAGGLVATTDRHSLFVWRAGHEIFQPLNLHHTRPYTCVALSADDRVLAAGDASGRILIWQDFDGHVPSEKREGGHAGKHQPEGPLPVTTLHWHAHAVGCLQVSADGVFLLSGGAEGVLVQWQLEGHKRTYLPRLGGPLVGLHASPADAAVYCVRQGDNTLRLVNMATAKVDASVLGLRPAPRGLELAATASATLLQPRTGHLVLPCGNALLQFYDVAADRHVQQLHVAPRNATSDAQDLEGAHGAPAEPHVSHVAFSTDGSVMVTVDVRPDAGPYGSSEPSIKFWDQTTGAVASASASGSGAAAGPQPYALNTRADDPHAGQLLSLAYHPQQHMVVTTGADKTFRVWVRMRTARRPGSAVEEPHCWRMQSIATYKEQPLTAAAFADDGSCLAVAAGPNVTLWDPSANRLAAVLCTPPARQQHLQPLTMLAFVPTTPYLVAASAGSLVVWNLLTSAVQWSYSLPVCSLAADPLHGAFAVALRAMTQPAATETAATAAAAGGPSGGGSRPAAASPPQQGNTGDTPDSGTPDTPAPGAASAYQPSASQAEAVRSKSLASHVLVFAPDKCVPRLHCAVPGTAAVHVMYMTPGMPAHQAAAAQAPPGSSPLLMLTQQRAFAVGLAAEAVQSSSDDGQQQQQETATAADAAAAAVNADGAGSAFEAAFGKLPAANAAAGLAEPTAVEAKAAAPQDTAVRLQLLFDAPSHLLPPPSRLATSFMQILAAASSTQPSNDTDYL